MNQKKAERTSEYNKFEDTVRHLLKVPHSEIKEKLEAEKAQKAAKKKEKKADA